ncbi:pyruvate:ferredoxin (flavodoxin) oxidoreductase [Clostridium estertheticum]|uniref:pyruvate:ferredoxin (flavodoxin) oxidoreductase n=1 Tax=Clostridium estertheticum TaxID=238834 RepID=UPI001C0AD5C5|nr:pyruvate:ferredoxin (flavodoxin) oxidoreductase [Clostridium estertheticum]MBU3199044.1 pyruvate:ferredoxin (flavodoxin) oxidoreductase [Clostridium estertheticum]WAG63690.1 pyruvate:ferredoxin (flavodoxin) oxidoreductase [Clostridium estertheticum]
MTKVMKTMDGNEACAYVSYAFTEVATIYPITPSSPMAEHVDEWSAKGKKNLFGQTVKLVEMESEAGAIGAVHGSLEAGALTTSYTASQGLLLMVPTMYRIAGQLKPGVLHVSARTVGTHALSIFGDHSDVMSCRQTGFAMMSTASVQEVMDLSGVAHLSAIKGRVPFLHFFDGFRTSHEIQKIECLEYDDLAKLIDQDALKAFRKNSLNPERPVQRSTVQNPDIFFQAREASNRFYDAIPGIVENYMNDINKITKRNYKLFNYYGATDADRVIIAMGSVCGAIEETIDYLNANGQKVGLVKVHLFRPFSVEHLLKAIPQTVKNIAVLDRTKEPGSAGEPLFEDVCTAYVNKEVRPKLYGGRYGLSSKDTTPAQIVAVYENLKQGTPKDHFTVGINDDVTHHSILVGEELDVLSKGTISCKFWGLGSDGTVGANKNSIKIIGDHTDMFVQAYFVFDTKKSGGVTQSHLRFGKEPIRSSYLVKGADFIACHNFSYLEKYDIISDLKYGKTFLLNCCWKGEELEKHLPSKVKQYIAKNNIEFYTIDASRIAKELGLGRRSNTVLQAAFFKLANIIPIDDAVEYMKKSIYKSYSKKGDIIVNMNYGAVDKGIEGVVKVEVPSVWVNEVEEASAEAIDVPDFIKNILIPVNAQKGDSIPVSAFIGMEDGTVPLGTSAFEKRGIATEVPSWNVDNCIQCNQCSFVCPHAAIRPFLASTHEVENAPDGFKLKGATGKGLEDYKYRIQVDTLDCTGCGICSNVCPAKEKALTMEPIETQQKEMDNWYYALSLSKKENCGDIATVKGSQFEKPLLEFSGACAGCGETPYAKVITQLYGDRMYLASATGCCQAWGAASPCVPYTTNSEGHGPAWSNSLFENNAEFSLGMCLAVNQQRELLKSKVEKIINLTNDSNVKSSLKNWIDNYSNGKTSKVISKKVLEVLEKANLSKELRELANEILASKEHLAKKSMWMYGGDGWAYDIGFGGLDHVLSRGEDVNIIVFDTEVYSNTGGQSSKATPIGAVAQFASSGKKFNKKDLGMMAMSYGNVYVAQVAMGGSQSQFLKAVIEAENYPGSSLIIAYAPCISHGLKGGMSTTQANTKRAVEVGYWHLYRCNPALEKEGKNPFILDSKEPTGSFREFLLGEVRYSSLLRTFPENAEELFAAAEKASNKRYQNYRRLASN